MKDSMDHSPQQATVIKHELCSEKCGTCLENRGCIYDQYLFAAILNMETSQFVSCMNKVAQQAVNEHNLLPNAVAA